MIKIPSPIQPKGTFPPFISPVKALFYTVKTKSVRNQIPSSFRHLDSQYTTMCFVEEDGVVYKLTTNPDTDYTLDSDWETALFNPSTTPETPIGTWNINNATPELTDAGAEGKEGQYYYVWGAPTSTEFTDADLFEGNTKSIKDGDIVVSVGTHWAHKPAEINFDVPDELLVTQLVDTISDRNDVPRWTGMRVIVLDCTGDGNDNTTDGEPAEYLYQPDHATADAQGYILVSNSNDPLSILLEGGKIKEEYLPNLSISEFQGNFSDLATALADAGVNASERGDWFTVDDDGSGNPASYIVTTDAPTLSGDVTKIKAPTGGFSVSGTDTAGAVITADGAGGGTREADLTWDSSTRTLSVDQINIAGGAGLPGIWFSSSNTAIMTVSGGAKSNGASGQIKLYGASHATKAKEIEFYTDATLRTFVSASGDWDFQGNALTNFNTFNGVNGSNSIDYNGNKLEVNNNGSSIYLKGNAISSGSSDNLIFQVNAGGTTAGSITTAGVWGFSNNRLTSVADPTSAQDAATKNYVDTNAGTSGLLKKTVTITSAEMLALNSTPKQLLAAAGAGNYYNVFKVVISVDYNSAAYATATGLIVEYSLGGTDIVGPGAAASGLTATGDYAWVGEPDSTIPEINSAIQITAAGGDPTAGNSDFKITLYYTIESI